MDRIKLNNRNKSVMLLHSYWRTSHSSFVELWITKLLTKSWIRKSWKEIEAGKRVRGWLRRRGCVGDEEVRGQRSAPPVISPEPERQSRPGQRRFRCQRETTDWQDQAGPLLRSVPLGPFILPSLPFPVTPPWPIPPYLQTLFALLAVCLPTEPQPCHPLILPSFLSPHSPSFSPLKLNITTGFHSAGRADWGSSLWGCMSSVRHHVLTFKLWNIHVHRYAHRLLACSLKFAAILTGTFRVFKEFLHSGSYF